MNRWNDFFQIFRQAFTPDPLTRKADRRDLDGAGFSDIRGIRSLNTGDEWGGFGSNASLHDVNPLVDVNTLESRSARYKEYERLRSVPEIEMCMTVFADEACLAGDTEIETPFGHKTVKWLAENQKEKFLVYSWDRQKEDYTLGWAFNPRLTGRKKTVRVCLDDGTTITCTPDHRILSRDNEWKEAGSLKFGDELMPFYRCNPIPFLNHSKVNQFPRIFTFKHGWMTERVFADAWRFGKTDPKLDKVQRAMTLISQGVFVAKVAKAVATDWKTVEGQMKRAGFTLPELRFLGGKQDRRRVIGTEEGEETEVYDISVENHHCFCGKSVVFHNCQKDETGHVCKVTVDDRDVKEEAEYLLFNILDLDNPEHLWNDAKNLFTYGDRFWEIVIDPESPKDGVLKIKRLPCETMFRIETDRGRLVEFQQADGKPDLAVINKPITYEDLNAPKQTSTIRFTPEQIVHLKIGEDRKTFYPYGVSLIEAARAAANVLRMFEDAMLVYRVSRAPERRVFYIDIGQTAPFRSEAFIERLKDQFKKRKTSLRGGLPGASSIEEKVHFPSADEDIWIPLRPNSNTRVETLPGACLALDTKIPFLDGKERTLREAIDAFDAGETLWTYSCDPTTGRTAPGLVTWAGVTRKNTQVVKVTFDNGQHVVCTPDHKFPTQNKGKTQAQHLQPGDSMFPFKTRMERLSSGWKTEYRQVYDTHKRDWVFEHRMVTHAVAGTQFEQVTVYSDEYSDEEKTIIHHKDINKENNNPGNLTWMGYRDHKKLHRDNQETTNKNISEALIAYHKNLSPDDRKKRDETLKERSKQAKGVFRNKLDTDPVYREEYRKNQVEGWARSKKENPELHKKRGKNTAERGRKFMTDPKYREKVFVPQTIVYPKSMFDELLRLTVQGLLLDEALPLINSDEELLRNFADANAHIKRKIDFSKGLSVIHAKKMVKANGYTGVKHFRREAKNFNHKVVSVEFLTETVDTGTLTIDGNHLVHNHHTFAISDCGIYVYNSNLDQIADSLYFRNKLFNALNFPKNYFNAEDVTATRVSLSAQDVKFARMIERLQSHIEKGLNAVVKRHLALLGYPEESFEDLMVEVTPPSDWRELSRAEVITNRINNASSLKGSQLLADYDILTKWMKYGEEEALEMIARVKIQKYEDLKMQIIAQNPSLLGVGLPGDGETEIGAQPGGPTPELAPPDQNQGSGQGGDQGPPGGDQGPPGGDQDSGGGQQPPKGKPLPDPSPEDLKKYDLEIQDYATTQDDEDIDYSEEF